MPHGIDRDRAMEAWVRDNCFNREKMMTDRQSDRGV